MAIIEMLKKAGIRSMACGFDIVEGGGYYFKFDDATKCKRCSEAIINELVKRGLYTVEGVKVKVDGDNNTDLTIEIPPNLIDKIGGIVCNEIIKSSLGLI